jgi:hypothetical protein
MKIPVGAIAGASRATVAVRKSRAGRHRLQVHILAYKNGTFQQRQTFL